jgi:GGDEF domain-containing protein
LSAVAAAELASRSQEDELLSLTTQLRREVRAFTQVRGHSAGLQPQPHARRASDYDAEMPIRQSSAVVESPLPSGPAAVAPVATEQGLAGRVSAAINRCRLAHGPLSLALVAVDQYGDLLLQLGPGGVADVLYQLRIELGGWAGQRTGAAHVGEETFALLWENCPRSDAVAAVRQVLSHVKSWRMPGPIGQDLELSLSAGVATLALPPKNFPPQQLIDAAQRCLSGVQLSGGATVKSIEF